MRTTVKQLATNLGVEYIVASSLLKLMEKSGAAASVGTESASGKGKPARIYEVPESFTIQLSDVKAGEAVAV